MIRLVKLTTRFRIFILAATFLVTGVSAVALLDIHSNDDMMRFLPQDDPDALLFKRVNQRFGGLDVAIIGLESKNLFTHRNIKKIRELTKKLTAIEGVYDVLSFTEIPNPQPSAEGLRVTPLVMDHIPKSPQELQTLKKAVLSNHNAVGNLVSANGKAAMVLCFLGGDRPRIRIAENIKTVAAKVWGSDTIYFAGSPFIRLYIAGGTYDDLVRLTPLVALVVLLVTFLIFRTPLGVLLSLGATAIAIVWVMAILVIKSDGITLVDSSLPTILMAIGGAYGMHVLAAYFNGSASTVPDRIVEMFQSVGPPVLASGATTAAGFLSFLVMDVEPLRQFGIHAAIGIVIAMLLSLFFIPAILSFQKRPPSPLRGAFSAAPLIRITRFSSRHRLSIVVVSLLLGAFSITGIRRISPDATMETFFEKGSAPDAANRFLERHFGGASYLQVYFEGDLRSPFVMYQLQKIVEFARSLDEVEQVSSITDSLIMMSEAMGGRADIPLNNRRVGSLYPFLEGTAAIEQMISREKDASLVQIRLKNVSAEQVEKVIQQFRRFIRDEIPQKVEAVQIGPFAIPDEARHAYSSPAQKDATGKTTLPARQTVIDQSLSDRERQTHMNQLRSEVASRLIRLAKVHQRHHAPKWAKQALTKLFSRYAHQNTVAILPELESACKEVIHEHLITDYMFMKWDDDPDSADSPAVTDASAEQKEWAHRGDLVFNQFKPHAAEFIQSSLMKKIIKDALPLTCQRDPEGLTMTADAMAQSYALRRSMVKANYLLQPALDILELHNATKKTRSSIFWALTTLDLPVFGFPGNAAGAVPVMAQITGSPVVNIAICESTIANQVKSITLAAILVFLVMLVAFRSAVVAVKGMLPALLMLAVSVGLMGAFSVPIDMSTSMIATIALGIGVDYSLHFLWRQRMRNETLEVTTQEVGPSILGNAIQVAAGFSVLVISSMIPVRRFGLLIAITMLLCAATTFLLLPALGGTRKRQNTKEKAGSR